MTVVYKSGRKHSDADCLSRAPVETPSGSSDDDDDECFLGAVNTDDMARRQRDDPELRALIEHLEGRGDTVPRVFSRALPTFAIRQGVLYKENFGTTTRHGCCRTLARIREKYYWPKLPKTVHLYTRSCHECQRRKKPRRGRPDSCSRFLLQLHPSSRSEWIYLVLFRLRRRGNRWIIVATDYLTRYAETKALPSGTAVEVAKFFIESIVLRHGAPEVLISDRGSSFMAQLTQEILRLSHTSHRRTTAYHPQTNGLTERLNKTIADMISMYVDVEHKTWDEVLPYVTFAYNTAVQETTG
ncbi:DDE-type integrase/transposase/recombinase [Ixodes scapularis]